MTKTKILLYSIVAFLFVQTLFINCSFHILADYDKDIADEIVKTAKDVDAFFLLVLDTDPNRRQYETFITQYRKIESDLSSLLLKNRIRPLNEESIKISENTLEAWRKLKSYHKERTEWSRLSDGEPNKISTDKIFSDVMIENNRRIFFDNFSAMAVAEYAKKLGTTNTNGE